MLVHIAHGAITAIRAHRCIEGAAAGSDAAHRFDCRRQLHRAEIIAGVMILATLGVPSLLPLLPCTVVLALVASLVAGHTTWRQSALVAGALVVAVLASRQIEFPLWPVNLSLSAQGTTGLAEEVVSLGWLALFVGVMLAVIVGLLWERVAAGGRDCADLRVGRNAGMGLVRARDGQWRRPGRPVCRSRRLGARQNAQERPIPDPHRVF